MAIILLIKFFAEEAHADQFLNGRLYLNRLSFFKKMEAGGLFDGRNDENEAAAMWWQPDNLVMELNIPGIGATKITKADLAGPVSMSFDASKYLHVFCMYAVAAERVSPDGGTDLTSADVEQLQRDLALDPRCAAFGKFAVILHPKPFIERVIAEAKARNLLGEARLVEYYDQGNFHGEIPPKDIPFRKQKRFEYQHEYRVCIQTGTTGDDPLILELGSLRDIGGKVVSPDLNNILTLHLEPIKNN